MTTRIVTSPYAYVSGPHPDEHALFFECHCFKGVVAHLRQYHMTEGEVAVLGQTC